MDLDGVSYREGYLEGKIKNLILDMLILGYWLFFKWIYWVNSWIFKFEF